MCAQEHLEEVLSCQRVAIRARAAKNTLPIPHHLVLGLRAQLAPLGRVPLRETAPEVTLAEQSQQLSQRTPTASKRCSESGLAFEQF